MYLTHLKDVQLMQLPGSQSKLEHSTFKHCFAGSSDCSKTGRREQQARRMAHCRYDDTGNSDVISGLQAAMQSSFEMLTTVKLSLRQPSHAVNALLGWLDLLHAEAASG